MPHAEKPTIQDIAHLERVLKATLSPTVFHLCIFLWPQENKWFWQI